MEMDLFKDERDFFKKYPSRIYVCSNCGYKQPSRYNCQKCGWRADGLLKTWGKGYKFKILSTGKEYEIFKPLEIEKETTDDKRTTDKRTT